MQLSNAMAMGRVILAPRAGDVLTSHNRGCALGMAGMAAGLGLTVTHESLHSNNLDNYKLLTKKWPWLKKEAPNCPICSYTCFSFLSSIAHIFDGHVMYAPTWTLDQLIDWVRSVEPPEETATESSPVQMEQAVSA